MIPIETNFVKVKIQNSNHETRALIDTGASISCIAESFYRSLPSQQKTPLEPPLYLHVTGVGGEIHKVLGRTTLKVLIDGYEYSHNFHVFSYLHHHLILGTDFLEENQATIDLGNKTLSLKNGEPLNVNKQLDRVAMVRTLQHIHVPPTSEALVPARISQNKAINLALIQPTQSKSASTPYMVATTLAYIENGKTTCRILNPNEETLHIPPGTIIGIATHVEDEDIEALECDSPSVNLAQTDNSTNTNSQEAINLAKKMGIQLDNPALSDEQKSKLLDLIGRNRDVFATKISELGKTNVHTHRIETGDAMPVRKRPYRTSPKIEAEINKQIGEMSSSGIIEPSTSMWQSPVVMVKKKSNEMRFAIDYRNLNKVTKQISFPLPRLDNVFDKLGQASASWFSTLDLASGFWQVPLDPETKEKTTFITNDGQKYNFTVLPFGLVNAPSTYQMVMDDVLRGLNWKILLCYIDDIIIFSSSFEEHLHHLDLVFQRLRKANLTLKPSKCTFGAQRVMYLGHYLSTKGIEVDPDKIKAVKEFPRPKNPREVRGFIGLCSFYRRFINNFSKIATPLHELTKNDVKFEWTDQREKAFQTLKQALLNTPVLRYPDWNKPFILTTDASITAISYILGQKDEDKKEYAVAYGGRALKGAEKNYKIHELECLAMIEGVRAYHHYLSNQPFVAITDNIALKWLNNTKHTTPRLLRWSLVLQGYNYEIQHRPGTQNKNADALSRREYDSDISPQSKIDEACLDETAILSIDPTIFSKTTNKPKEDKPVKMTYETEFKYSFDTPEPALASINAISPINLAEAQKNCEDFAQIYRYLDTNELPTTKAEARNVILQSEQYILDNGVLFQLYTPRTRSVPQHQAVIRQLAVPKSWRADVLRSYHDSLLGGGHQGFDRTYAAIRLKYFWPKMYATVLDYVKSCDPCQRAKRHFHSHPAPLQNMPIVGRFDRWHMDILGPLSKSSEGHKYILLIVDSYTRWPEAFPLKTQEATEIGKVLYKEIFSRYGAPRSILSDRGQNFMSKLVDAICQLFQVTRLHTSSYHPCTNATCERMNSTLAQAIRTYYPNSDPNWPECLPGILMAYRMTPATQSTSLSPYFMVFGKQMNLPFDTALTPQEALPATTKTQIQYVLDNLSLSEKIANENLEKHRESSKTYYDKNCKDPTYNLGDRVMLHDPKVPKGESRKTHLFWTGPYYITAVLGHYNYRVRHSTTNKEMKSPVHANRLKPYHDPSDRILPTQQDVENPIPQPNDNGNAPQNAPQQIVPPDDPDATQTNAPKEYEAEKLLQTRVRSGKREYLVKWKDGQGIEPKSWESSEDISDFLIRHYHITHTMTGRKRKRKSPLTRKDN